MADADTILIIGAGQAGAVAAATLRELGHEGAITLVGQEAHAPYERPPRPPMRCRRPMHMVAPSVHPENFYERQRITLLTGTEVVRIDAGRRIARLADGRDLPYSRCLLATGGRARTARPAARHARRALHPHAGRRRRAARSLAPQARVAVIGGGFLGLEVAASARALGAEVSVLESAPRLLERVLPEALSDWLAERVRHAGVDLRLGRAHCRLRPPAARGRRHPAPGALSSPCRMPPPWRPTSWWWPSA